MGLRPNGSWSEDTIGDMIDAGSGLSAYCSDRRNCGRELDLDVYDLAIWFGRNQRIGPGHLRIRCTCGNRKIDFIHRAETRPENEARKQGPRNFRRRSPEEVAALKLVFPQRERWPKKLR